MVLLCKDKCIRWIHFQAALHELKKSNHFHLLYFAFLRLCVLFTYAALEGAGVGPFGDMMEKENSRWRRGTAHCGVAHSRK